MGVRNTTSVVCDYEEKDGQTCPITVQWCQEEIKNGIPLPTAAQEFISFNLNGRTFAFCGKLHASKFFLPDGFEVKQKKVIEFPDNGNFPKETEPQGAD